MPSAALSFASISFYFSYSQVVMEGAGEQAQASSGVGHYLFPTAPELEEHVQALRAKIEGAGIRPLPFVVADVNDVGLTTRIFFKHMLKPSPTSPTSKTRLTEPRYSPRPWRWTSLPTSRACRRVSSSTGSNPFICHPMVKLNGFSKQPVIDKASNEHIPSVSIRAGHILKQVDCIFQAPRIHKGQKSSVEREKISSTLSSQLVRFVSIRGCGSGDPWLDDGAASGCCGVTEMGVVSEG